MKCPFCGHENTRVIDSRPAEENNSIRRRRVCDECDKRFTTYEKVETIPLIIIKKDNNRETYDRSKIEAGVLRACHKRPISAGQIERLVDDVEAAIEERRSCAEAFEPYPSSRRREHPYYRIQVRNFTVFYVVIDGTMEVRRILYSRSDIRKKL